MPTHLIVWRTGYFHKSTQLFSTVNNLVTLSLCTIAIQKKLTSTQPPEPTTPVDSHLWLLHHDDSRFLYLSFALSVVFHALIFLILVSTRIFFPQTGSSSQFQMVWLAPDGEESPPKTGHPLSATAEHPPRRSKAPPKAAAQATTKTITVAKPPAAAFHAETEGEQLIARFGGKVVEVVQREDAEPTFEIISSVLMKSPGTKAVVQTIRETAKASSKPIERKKSTKLSSTPDVTQATPAINAGETESPEHVATTTAPPGQNSVAAQITTTPQQGMLSAMASGAVSLAKTTPAPDNATGSGSLAAAPSATTGTPKVHGTFAAAAVANGSAPVVARSTAGVHGQTRQTATTAPGATAATENAVITPPKKPQIIFQPPVFGDLKLIITTAGSVTVEADFREFRKSRRQRPLTRWEAKNHRAVIFKIARTREHVHEAVLASTEEGIYVLSAKAVDGGPLKALITLKINDYGLGGRTVTLGNRTINGSTVLARILMPEGILWDDESAFTGSMTDGDSVTKFNAETGLVWREYR
jgi:hypothetical protein